MVEVEDAQELVRAAERAVMAMLECRVSWNILRPLPDELPDRFANGFADPEDACQARWEELVWPREEAVADDIIKLRELWQEGLELLFLRHVDNPYQLRCCCQVLTNAHVEAPSVLTVCPWGCPGCCQAIVRDLERIRAGEGLRGKGKPKARQRARTEENRWDGLVDLMAALPASSEQGPRKTNQELANGLNVSRSHVQKLLKRARGQGLVEKPGGGRGYRRTRAGDEWVAKQG